MNYSKKPTKLFLKKLSKYSKTNKTIYNEIIESLEIITKNPFDSANKQLKSKKCPKCKRYRVRDYKIVYYVNTKKGFVEFIDIDDRANIYRINQVLTHDFTTDTLKNIKAGIVIRNNDIYYHSS